MQPLVACYWSADDRLLVTASDDQVALLRVERLSRVRVYRGHSAPVLCCSTNNVSSLLVTGSYDETVRLWDVTSAKCLAIIPAHSDAVTCVRFSHDSSVIVSMSSDDIVVCGCKHVYLFMDAVGIHLEFHPNNTRQHRLILTSLSRQLHLQWHR